MENNQNNIFDQNSQNNLFDQSNQKNVMKTSDWFITLLITAIPFVGFIMLIVWAVGDDSNINRKNFAKATLLWMIIGIVLGVLFYASIFAAIIAAAGAGYN